ncbi:MAG: hypothetical protein ACREHD_16845 [Pirellulales bacterium]
MFAAIVRGGRLDHLPLHQPKCFSVSNLFVTLSAHEMKAKDWPEVESKVCQPTRWLAFLLGSVFLTGIVGFLMFGGTVPPGMPQWIARSITAVCTMFGALALAAAIGAFVPVYVRHAHPDVLREVPSEPAICEGSVVHARLTHELVRERTKV